MNLNRVEALKQELFAELIRNADLKDKENEITLNKIRISLQSAVDQAISLNREKPENKVIRPEK